MPKEDPFRKFPVEVAESVLAYLDFPDLAHCEGVSRGWRDVVQEWIVSIGFRTRFPKHLPEDLAADKSEVVRRFKELGEIPTLLPAPKSTNERLATAYCNMLIGKATGIRRIEASGTFNIRGDFMVWLRGKIVFSQRLGFQENGFLHPERRLDLRQHLLSPRSSLKLYCNMEGYLIVREQRNGPDGNSIHAFFSETGELLWTLNGSDRQGPGAIQVVGKDRIYSTVCRGASYLRAHDLRSENQLYTSQLQYEAFSTAPMGSYSIPGPAVLTVETREILIFICRFSHRFANGLVIFIDGATGQVIQEMEMLGRVPLLYFSAAPSGKEIALISYDRDSDPILVQVQRFAVDTEAKLHKTSTDLISMPLESALRSIEVEPFHFLAAGLSSGDVPAICPINEVGPDMSQQDKAELEQLFQETFGESMFDRLLTTGKEQRYITPPRSSSHHNARRVLISKSGENNLSVSFGQGDTMILSKQSSSCVAPFVYNVFDFGLRVRSRNSSNAAPST